MVPLDLLPPDARSKYQAKPSDRAKRTKKEESKGVAHQPEENQVALRIAAFQFFLSRDMTFWTEK